MTAIVTALHVNINRQGTIGCILKSGAQREFGHINSKRAIGKTGGIAAIGAALVNKFEIIGIIATHSKTAEIHRTGDGAAKRHRLF